MRGVLIMHMWMLTKVNNWNYHYRLMKLIKVGGVVIYDDTLWVGWNAMPEEQTPEFRKSIQEFNKLLAADPRIQISQVPLGNGITVCRRIY
ncbi:hypothetical protein LWI28_023923 [Acer negundo]|uniref:Caffeoyl-CoA O-methyltransferase n=1 Tax=Acer negundo TaxID=4023 RepID=A0AAD5P089_ACENE|nr:hypothetical protein LWI28_023923 [Acer negundo]